MALAAGPAGRAHPRQNSDARVRSLAGAPRWAFPELVPAGHRRQEYGATPLRGRAYSSTWSEPSTADPDWLRSLAHAEGSGELRQLGRKGEAMQLERCQDTLRRLSYRCLDCMDGAKRLGETDREPEQEEVRGSCGSRRCPTCAERVYRATRRTVWERFAAGMPGGSDAEADEPWAVSAVVTVPLRDRPDHTPDQYTYWMRRLARAIEGWFAVAYSIRPTFLIAMHSVGETGAPHGVYHPHYNVLLAQLGERLQRVQVPYQRSDGRRSVRYRWEPTGELVDLSTVGWKANEKRPIPHRPDFCAFRRTLGRALDLPERFNCDIRGRVTLGQVAHGVRYVVRPVGEGYPDLQARWTWAYCRTLRPSGTIATGRAGRWKELAGEAPEGAAVAEHIHPPQKDRTARVCPHDGRTLRAVYASWDGDVWIPPALDAALASKDPKRIGRELARRLSARPPKPWQEPDGRAGG